MESSLQEENYIERSTIEIKETKDKSYIQKFIEGSRGKIKKTIEKNFREEFEQLFGIKGKEIDEFYLYDIEGKLINFNTKYLIKIMLGLQENKFLNENIEIEIINYIKGIILKRDVEILAEVIDGKLYGELVVQYGLGEYSIRETGIATRKIELNDISINQIIAAYEKVKNVRLDLNLVYHFDPLEPDLHNPLENFYKDLDPEKYIPGSFQKQSLSGDEMDEILDGKSPGERKKEYITRKDNISDVITNVNSSGKKDVEFKPSIKDGDFVVNKKDYDTFKKAKIAQLIKELEQASFELTQSTNKFKRK